MIYVMNKIISIIMLDVKREDREVDGGGPIHPPGMQAEGLPYAQNKEYSLR